MKTWDDLIALAKSLGCKLRGLPPRPVVTPCLCDCIRVIVIDDSALYLYGFGTVWCFVLVDGDWIRFLPEV